VQRDLLDCQVLRDQQDQRVPWVQLEAKVTGVLLVHLDLLDHLVNYLSYLLTYSSREMLP